MTKRTPTTYNIFCKENYATAKANSGENPKPTAVIKELAKMWNEHKNHLKTKHQD